MSATDFFNFRRIHMKGFVGLLIHLIYFQRQFAYKNFQCFCKIWVRHLKFCGQGWADEPTDLSGLISNLKNIHTLSLQQSFLLSVAKVLTKYKLSTKIFAFKTCFFFYLKTSKTTSIWIDVFWSWSRKENIDVIDCFRSLKKSQCFHLFN